ncbi:MAG: MOSC domain-containing protein [Candidatus Thermoplasmatota archaeon]|nr:MOSC domain-containing protein [Candidatus Thermoplasmatota archaeon]
MQGTVLALALRPEKGGAMALAESISLTPENGVMGDHGTSQRRQITLLDDAAWQTTCSEIGIELDWTVRRANVLVQGLDLPSLVNQRVQIGTSMVEIMGEVTPCYLMDEAQSGLEAALTPDWRGGVYARIVTSGSVEIGGQIEPIQSSQ